MPGLTEEQQRERRKGITGSEIKTVLAYYAAKEGREVSWPMRDSDSALALYRDKVCGPREWEPSLCAEAGQRLEPVLLDWYRDKTGNDLAREYQETVSHPDHPHHMGTPDAVVEDSKGRIVGVVELKSVWVREQHNRWSEQKDGIPAEYYLQGQWYSHILDTDWWHLFVFDAGDYAVDVRLYELERNQQVIDHMVECVDRFWEEHVLAEVPPEPDGSTAAGHALDDLRPEDAENIRVAQNAEEEELLERLADVKENRAHYNKLYKELKQKAIQRADKEGLVGIETVDGKGVKRRSDGSIWVST